MRRSLIRSMTEEDMSARLKKAGWEIGEEFEFRRHRTRAPVAWEIQSRISRWTRKVMYRRGASLVTRTDELWVLVWPDAGFVPGRGTQKVEQLYARLLVPVKTIQSEHTLLEKET